MKLALIVATAAAVTTTLLMPVAANAVELCELLETKTMDLLLPREAPWRKLGGRELIHGPAVPGLDTCSFAAGPPSSSDKSANPQSPTLNVRKIAMRSVPDAEDRVKNDLEMYQRTNDVQLLPKLGGDAFRYKSSRTDGDVVVFIGHKTNTFVLEKLVWPGKIAERDLKGAEQLMAVVLESAK